MAACLPSALRVDLGRCAMVRFFLAAETAFFMFLRAAAACFCVAIFLSLVALKKLNSAFVRPGFFQAGKSAQVAAFSCLGIFLAGIQAVLTGLQLADHSGISIRFFI